MATPVSGAGNYRETEVPGGFMTWFYPGPAGEKRVGMVRRGVGGEPPPRIFPGGSRGAGTGLLILISAFVVYLSEQSIFIVRVSG
jgi:hypothetical protein